MPDKFSKEKRSNIMSRIASKETKLEIEVRKFLFSKGFRYRKNVKSLPGAPDIVLGKYKTVIFLHGCFWHRHEACRRSKLPETRSKFWEKKISSNVSRDKRNIRLLEESGWNVLVVWQCEIRNRVERERRLAALASQIRGAKANNN